MCVLTSSSTMYVRTIFEEHHTYSATSTLTHSQPSVHFPYKSHGFSATSCVYFTPKSSSCCMTLRRKKSQMILFEFVTQAAFPLIMYVIPGFDVLAFDVYTAKTWSGRGRKERVHTAALLRSVFNFGKFRDLYHDL